MTPLDGDMVSIRIADTDTVIRARYLASPAGYSFQGIGMTVLIGADEGTLVAL